MAVPFDLVAHRFVHATGPFPFKAIDDHDCEFARGGDLRPCPPVIDPNAKALNGDFSGAPFAASVVFDFDGLHIEVLALDGTPLATHDGLTGTSFDVPDASFSGAQFVRLQVYADRSDDDGDFASLQFFEHWVQVGGLTADTTLITADTTARTADEG